MTWKYGWHPSGWECISNENGAVYWLEKEDHFIVRLQLAGSVIKEPQQEFPIWAARMVQEYAIRALRHSVFEYNTKIEELVQAVHKRGVRARVYDSRLTTPQRYWRARSIHGRYKRLEMGNSSVKHPQVIVRLVGEDGNGFMIASRVRRAMQRAGVSREECEEFFEEALSGDYDHLLQTVMEWVTVQ